MNALAEKYPDETAKILARYPDEFKRAAVMPLLYLAQRQDGYLKEKDLQDIAALLEITKTEVSTIVGFYTLFHDTPAGKYRLQVCTDLPCALRGADQFFHDLCENLAVKVGGTTEDGLFTIEEVKCLAGCHRAPMFQVQSGAGISYHENQTVESALQLVNSLREQEQTVGQKERG